VKNPINSADSQEKIFKVALPVSLEAVFQTSLGFIDQIIVGTLGSTAIAAVGLCNSISFIVMLLYSAIGTGCGVLLAQAFGRNDLNDISRLAALSLMSSGIFGLCTALPLILYPGTILKLIGAPDELVQVGSVYFQLFSASAPLDCHACFSGEKLEDVNMASGRTRTKSCISTETRTLCDFPLLIGEILRRADIRFRLRAERRARIQKIGALFGLAYRSKAPNET
jgi:hypothetical protein